jgi:hypothetical protein
VIRMARYAPFNPVAFVDPGYALVLGGVHDADEDLLGGRASSTWAFIAEPADPHSCRLIVRSRGRSLIARLQAPLQFMMQRKMMLGIKQRVEASGGSAGRRLSTHTESFLGHRKGREDTRREPVRYSNHARPSTSRCHP